MDINKKKRTTIYLPRELLRRMKKEALNKEINVSRYIELAVVQFLDAEK